MNPLDVLTKDLGAKVSSNPSVLEVHGRGESYPEIRAPVAVIFAESTEDVRRVLAWAVDHAVPVVPFGAGTSLEGQTVPQSSAVTLDLSRMNRVIEIRPEDFLVEVEPGVMYKELNKTLRRQGLFFPVDPGADASIGGMAGTNASGTTTVRYGGMRQNVLALEAVVPSGEVLRLGRPVRKTSSGYDLKDLFIGSEGTLGVITRLWLKLHALPAHVHTMRAFFPSVEAAAQGAYLIMGSALPVARLELLDALNLECVNWYLHRRYPEMPGLFLEFHSSSAVGLQAESAEARTLLSDAGAVQVEAATTAEERTAQWEARHQSYWAFVKRYPGRHYMVTDTAVPLSRMPELVALAHRLIDEMNLDASIVGHVGDGNFHTLIAVAPDAYERAETFSARMVDAALNANGTATGEHGIGLRKRKYLYSEHHEAVEWMRRLKTLFDPKGLLNPGRSWTLR